MIGGLLVVLTFLSALGSGLIAGVFFAFSAFVMTALGTVQALNTVTVNAQVSGQLMSLHFAEGEEIKQGARIYSTVIDLHSAPR